MARQRSSHSLPTFSWHFIVALLFAVLLGSLIYFIEPFHILVILTGSLLLSGMLFSVFAFFMSGLAAGFIAFFISLIVFLHMLSLLDIMNTGIVVALAISTGILLFKNDASDKPKSTKDNE